MVPTSNETGVAPTSHVLTLAQTFSREEYVLVESGRYTRIVFRKGVTRGEEGFPALPARKVFAIIEPGSNVVRLTEKVEKFYVAAENVLIQPLPPNVPTVLGAVVKPAEPHKNAYDSNEAWPKTAARVLQTRQEEAGTLVELEICPFRFYPKMRRLEAIEKIELTLEYEIAALREAPARQALELRYLKKKGERLKKLVVNPQKIEEIERRQVLGDLRDFTMLPQIVYVIITSDALSGKFRRLAEWRTTFGLRSRVVTVEDILAGTVPDTASARFYFTTGYLDGGTRDIAEAIRNFTKWAAVNWLTTHVLLGGDTEVIPVRKALHTQAGLLPYGDINQSNRDHRFELAYGASASSEKAGCPVSSVLDRDQATYWECQPTDAAPSITLDVGDYAAVNCVDLVWGTSFASSYVVEVSPNGVTWTEVGARSGGTGGSESVNFACVSASNVRIRITSGPAFSMLSAAVYGPGRCSFQMSPTVTRVYPYYWIGPNPSNNLDNSVIIITEGQHAGMVVPYDDAASDTSLGWRFVQDLVALPGTVSTTWTRFIEIRGPAEFHGQNFAMKEDINYIPADLYYADVSAAEYPVSQTHDWDADNNGLYGERYGDGVDRVNSVPDLLVGRASVQSEAEVDDFIDKILRYERYVCKDEFGMEMVMPQDFAVSVLLGSEDFEESNTQGRLDTSAAGKEDIRHALSAFASGRWLFRRLYQDYADVPAADQGPDLEAASSAAMISAITANHHVVGLSGHGNPGYVCYLVSSDIDDVANFPGIWYGNSCLTNRIDTEPGECFGEAAMRNFFGGAVAYAGNTRFGWTGDNDIEKAFWEEMLEGETLGEMFHAAKLVCHDWAKYSLNLLGDPAMRVWSDRPKQVTVTHDSLAYTGIDNFEVKVFAGGVPVAGAAVCCTMTGSMFGRGTTDAAGKAIVAINPSVTGLMKVAVSGKNLLPYLGAVTVKAAEGGVCKKPVACPANILCKINLICTTSIFCNEILTCKTKVSCKTGIVCKLNIFCKQDVSCPISIKCGDQIGCKSSLCGAVIGCGGNIVPCRAQIYSDCRALRPDDWDVFRELEGSWGIHDPEAFARLSKTAEYAKRIESLPPEMRKAVRMMIEHILAEETE